jgi:lipoyl(octanoyl) transferase
MPESNGRPLEISRLGRVPYAEAASLQEGMVARRRRGEIPDQLLLLEHPHVITLGTSSKEEHLLLSDEELEARDTELHLAGRGGDVTYHGPGQLVGYPILDLKPDRKDLHRYLRDLEEMLIRALDGFGIRGWREAGYTGVWTSAGKVAAIGVRVSSGWITSHGFALNVNPDLDQFSSIVPCGILDRDVTSMARLLGEELSLDDVIPGVTGAFLDVFERDLPVV